MTDEDGQQPVDIAQAGSARSVTKPDAEVDDPRTVADRVNDPERVRGLIAAYRQEHDVPDERAAGRVLPRAGSLADEQHVTERVALPGDGVGTSRGQRAARADPDLVRDPAERGRAVGVRLAGGAGHIGNRG